MKLLPGRPQSTPQALCTGEWQRQRIVAYISGTSVVILADGVDNLVQTIYLPHRLHAVAFDEKHTGKIAVCAAGGGIDGSDGDGGDGQGAVWVYAPEALAGRLQVCPSVHGLCCHS